MRILIKLLCLLPLISFAAPAPEKPDIWQPVAEKICTQINDAVKLYKKNDLKAAKTAALMSYFKGYDAEIEPAVRVTLGGPHVFEIERQFRDFSQFMTPNPDSKQLQKISTLAKTLCDAVHEDAKALNADQVPRQVFKVD